MLQNYFASIISLNREFHHAGRSRPCLGTDAKLHFDYTFSCPNERDRSSTCNLAPIAESGCWRGLEPAAGSSRGSELSRELLRENANKINKILWWEILVCIFLDWVGGEGE